MSPSSPINQSGLPSSARCECGHVYAAHGTNGNICCLSGCSCKKFVEKKSDDHQ